jgi:hypothetical protein
MAGDADHEYLWQVMLTAENKLSLASSRELFMGWSVLQPQP